MKTKIKTPPLALELPSELTARLQVRALALGLPPQVLFETTLAATLATLEDEDCIHFPLRMQLLLPGEN